MGKQILVPLKKEDRMEEVFPYIEEIVQPGMKVQFLVRHETGWDMALWAGHLAESRVRDSVAIRQIRAMYSQEDQQQVAAATVLPACESLRKKGAEVTVDVYTGSVRRMVRRHVANGDVHLVVMQSGIGSAIGNLLSGAASMFGFKQVGYRPVYLLHPIAAR